MNAEQIENQEIWKQVKNSEKLFEIYNYFPTLHDAKIRKVDLNLAKREFYLTVDYCDFINKPGDEVSTRFTICWCNVSTANFDWVGEDLYGMKFVRNGDSIKTKFEYGFDGELVASEIEIVNVEIEPKEPELNIIKFSIE